MYQKHTWISKEIIRREYLQNIEDGIYNEEQRAIQAEDDLSSDISAEARRATTQENALQASVLTNRDNIANEVTRATNRENTIASDLTAETERAIDAEDSLLNGINNVGAAITSEISRATAQETTIAGNLQTETARAIAAENTLTTNLSAEITRATGAENTLTSSLNAEVSRAQTAELALHDYVDEKVSTAYKVAGSVYFANLPVPTQARQGYVYDIKDDFTTTANFVEGAGKKYKAGTNVAVVYNESTSSYLYDVFTGFVNFDDYVRKTDYATSLTAGIVKPDNQSIKVDSSGVINAVETNFVGTMAQWNALTTTQKAQYKTLDIIEV